MAAKTPQNPADEPCFEEALLELEIIVRELEEGEIGLAQGLARYEAGVKMLKQCYQMLEHVERRIELLNRIDSDGGVQSEPFEDGALSLDEKAQTRGRRRSRATPDARTEPDNGPPATDEIDGPRRLF